MKKYFLSVVLYFQLCCCIAQTVLPVRDEPRHHNVFQNNFVRILDVRIPPGDTTQFHKHETPSVFIVLHRVKTGSEVLVEEAKATALAPDAAISFEGFYTSPRIHRVWNEDTAAFHVMDIELPDKAPQQSGAPIQQKAFKLLFDEKPVRGYRLTLEGKQRLRIAAQTSFLVVGLTDALQPASVNNQSFNKKGDFLFIPAGGSISFANSGGQPYAFAVLELK